ncbi:hypothetical protein [Longitalea arenae]|uniref:hypothetical protein n=1 Tax=Longitalea arenae TaxID=2812558 RepID=UPI0019688057|nr:hypothetical protein [Longitalea arenae]
MLLQTDTTHAMEIFHSPFNLEQKDNLDQLPPSAAVFGIFAIVNEQPVNCRYVGYTDNLRQSIAALFEHAEGGLKLFMQGPWIKMLKYQLTGELAADKQQQFINEWNNKYYPRIDSKGEYPGYYE